MILTDELIEKAKTAANNEDVFPFRECDEFATSDMIKAAITAIIPDILEAAAKVAEDKFPNPVKKGSTLDVCRAAGFQIATAIRSIIHNP